MVEKKCIAMFCQNCQFFGCTPRLNCKIELCPTEDKEAYFLNYYEFIVKHYTIYRLMPYYNTVITIVLLICRTLRFVAITHADNYIIYTNYFFTIDLLCFRVAKCEDWHKLR